MAQVKIYALRTVLEHHRNTVSDAVHQAVVEALQYPMDKRFHRFFPLEPEDFIFPPDRSDHYLILEITMFEGRSVEAKKKLVRTLFERLEPLGFSGQDVEIVILESPKHNWGIRGVPADELALNYRVEV
jgi:phenylpyruvate tautomerase PptA (4-oxalocrotonate tautomerase family)